MQRLLKIAYAVFGLFLLVFMGAFTWASIYIDAPEVRDDISTALTSIVGRDVKIEGDLDITVFPWLGISGEDFSIANEPGFGASPFVTIREISFGIAVMPLIQKELEIRAIVINGMRVNLIRDADARVNWDDFAARAEQVNAESSGKLPFKRIFIHGIEIQDALMTFDDGVQEENYSVKGLDAFISSFEPGDAVGFSVSGDFVRKNDMLTAEAAIKGVLDTDFSSKRSPFRDTSIDLEVKDGPLPEGEALRIVSSITYEPGSDTLDLTGMHARLFDVDMDGGVKVDNLLGEWQASGQAAIEKFNPVTVLKKCNVDKPFDKIQTLRQAQASFAFDVKQDKFHIHDINMKLDQSTLTGGIVGRDFNALGLELNLFLDKLDLDQYLPLFKTEAPSTWDNFSLPFWGKLKAKGKIHADSFTVQEIEFSDLGLSMMAEKGSVSFKAQSGVLGGHVAADMENKVSLQQNAPGLETSLSATFEQAEIGLLPWTKGDWGKLKAKGKYNLTLNLKQDSCTATAPPAEALRNLTLDASADVSDAEYNSNQTTIELDTTKAALKLAPLQGPDGKYTLNTNIKLSGNKGKKVFTLAVNGPLQLGTDFETISSSGLEVSSSHTGWLLPDAEHSASLKSHFSFTDNLESIKVKNTLIRGYGGRLETSFSAQKPLEKSRVISGVFKASNVNLRELLSSFDVPLYETADKNALTDISASADFACQNKKVKLGKLHANVDGVDIDGTGTLGIEKYPSFSGRLNFGSVDLDKYLSPERDPDLKKIRAGIDEDDPPVELPLEFLKNLDVNTEFWMEQFKIEGMRIESFKGKIETRDNIVSLRKGTGMLYGGQLQAKGKSLVRNNALELSVDLQSKGTDSGQLLKDMTEKDYVRGTTDISLRLNSKGKTNEDLLASLAGNIDVAIGKGSFKFSTWEPAPQAAANGKEAAKDPTKLRTPFSKASSSWTIKKGYFSTDDLRVQSTLLEASGKGGFSPHDDSIDLSIKAEFAGVPSVTIDIKGHLQDPEVNVPKDKLLRDTVNNILGIPLKPFRFLRDLFF